MLRSILKKGVQPLRTSAVVQQRGFAAAAGGDFDVVVIGGGPGGYVAAIKAAQLGLKTACVEQRGSLGGTCLNVGCIPSKAMLNASHHYHDAKTHFKKIGIDAKVDLNLKNMLKQKDRTVTGLTKGIEMLYKKNKVTYFKGKASFKSANEISVAGLDGKDDTIKTKNTIIATGSDVAKLPNVDIDEETIISSTGALELKEVPKHMVVIGGGVIGLEMGSVWGRLGSKITVVEFLDHIVPGSDGEISKNLQQILKKQKMDFKLNTKVEKAEKTANGVKLTVSPAAGGDTSEIEADVVLCSIGRAPYTDGLNLEGAGIEMEGRGMIKVDDHFRTNVPGVYAIGDVIRGPMLAHKAEEEGIAAAEIIAGKAGHVNYDAIPGVIYTHPEVANVGKTEEQCKADGIKYNVGKFPFMANSRARCNDDTEGLVKVISDAKTDRLLGMHIIGAGAGEMIAEGCIGLEYGASSEDIARTCHAHPTLSEAVKEACMGAYDKAIHF